MVDVPEDPLPFERDQGLQAERTALAWSRTAFAVLVNALLALRIAWVQDQFGFMLLGGMLMVCTVVTLLVGSNRRRRLAAGAASLSPPPRSLFVIAALIALAGGVALLSVAHRVLF